MSTVIDTLIHVNEVSARQFLENRLVCCTPGVVKARLQSHRPHLFFVSYDPEQFSIASVQEFARILGTQVQVVGL